MRAFRSAPRLPMSVANVHTPPFVRQSEQGNCMKKLSGIIVLLLAGAALYLALKTSPIDPLAWDAPAAPQMTGVLEPNDTPDEGRAAWPGPVARPRGHRRGQPGPRLCRSRRRPRGTPGRQRQGRDLRRHRRPPAGHGLRCRRQPDPRRCLERPAAHRSAGQGGNPRHRGRRCPLRLHRRPRHRQRRPHLLQRRFQQVPPARLHPRPARGPTTRPPAALRPVHRQDRGAAQGPVLRQWRGTLGKRGLRTGQRDLPLSHHPLLAERREGWPARGVHRQPAGLAGQPPGRPQGVPSGWPCRPRARPTPTSSTGIPG